MQHIPELQVCKDKQCDGSCNLFHPSVEESVTQLFQDVWARAYSRAAGGRAPPPEAELFQAFVRVPYHPPFQYIEPRSSEGLPHASWAVVWLPGASFAEASHALRTNAKALALVRLGSRYGLRTRDADEQSLFETFEAAA